MLVVTSNNTHTKLFTLVFLASWMGYYDLQGFNPTSQCMWDMPLSLTNLQSHFFLNLETTLKLIYIMAMHSSNNTIPIQLQPKPQNQYCDRICLILGSLRSLHSGYQWIGSYQHQPPPLVKRPGLETRRHSTICL